ncbi:MAG TPA: hypothetical protein VIG66_11295 [Noviherbaspirillum sp.]
MSPWILPALKAVLPHVGTIVEAAKPMFSKTRPSDSDPEQYTQIAELQAAAAQNDAHIRELAAQLQSTVAALEQAAAQAEAQAQRMQRMCWIAVGVAVAALALALAALTGR